MNIINDDFLCSRNGGEYSITEYFQDRDLSPKIIYLTVDKDKLIRFLKEKEIWQECGKKTTRGFFASCLFELF